MVEPVIVMQMLAKKSATVGWSRVIGDFAHTDPQLLLPQVAQQCAAGWAPRNPSGCILFARTSICAVEVATSNGALTPPHVGAGEIIAQQLSPKLSPYMRISKTMDFGDLLS